MKRALTLTARWNPNQDSSRDEPSWIYWEDLRMATMADYIAHSDDTYFLTEDDGVIERTMCPGVIAVLRFDRRVFDWVATVSGLIPWALDIPDADAKDDVLIAEMSTGIFVYKVSIIRDNEK